MKLTINPKYARLRGFTESLPRIFPTSTGGKTLYEGRNIVKLYTQNGQRITVKSYGHLTLFNRLIYGSLRKSKAERAFRHAIRLQCLGIDTPEAIASLEIRRFGMLRDSYFVSAYTDYLPVSDITASFPQNPDSQNMLDRVPRRTAPDRRISSGSAYRQYSVSMRHQGKLPLSAHRHEPDDVPSPAVSAASDREPAPAGLRNGRLSLYSEAVRRGDRSGHALVSAQRGVAASVSRGMAPPAAQNQNGISRDPPGRKDGFRHSGKIEILPSGGAAAAGTRRSARMTLYR